MTNDDGTEERLGAVVRRSVSRQADALEIQPDEDDLFARVRRRGARRQRGLAIAAVLLLALGAVGGYLVGNSGGDGPTVEALVRPGDGANGAAQSSASPVASAGVPNGPLQHLLNREANGVGIRVYQWARDNSDPPTFDSLVAEMSNQATIGYGYLDVCGDAPLVIGGGITGVAEGSPFAWVIVRLQGPAVNASTVRADFGASRDAMQPVDATAVLAGPIDAAADGALAGTVEALDATGAVVASVTLDTIAQPGCVSETAPGPPATPTTLPEATGPAPDDIQSATAAVTEAYETAFTGANPVSVKRSAMEDSEALAPVLDQARVDGQSATNNQLDNMTITVHKVQFIDATHAAVVFDLDITGYGLLWTDHIGYAVMVDQTWKVARQTVCDEIALTNVRCPAP